MMQAPDPANNHPDDYERPFLDASQTNENGPHLLAINVHDMYKLCPYAQHSCRGDGA